MTAKPTAASGPGAATDAAGLVPLCPDANLTRVEALRKLVTTASQSEKKSGFPTPKLGKTAR